MVDFQSRDTRRGSDSDDTEPEETAESDEENPAEGDDTSEQPTAEEQTDNQIDPDELSYAVVTVTDERPLSEDAQGDVVVDAIEGDGGVVATRELIQPSYDGVQSTLSTVADRGDVDVIVTIGGTGVEPGDVTINAVEPLFDKRLPGFGELFRQLAREEHGSAVVGTRTTAGIIDGVPVFAIPGTMDGALLAVDEIVLSEAGGLATDASQTGADTEQ